MSNLIAKLNVNNPYFYVHNPNYIHHNDDHHDLREIIDHLITITLTAPYNEHNISIACHQANNLTTAINILPCPNLKEHVKGLQFTITRLRQILYNPEDFWSIMPTLTPPISPPPDVLINRCLGCGIDMGECNPRQYCRKSYCPALETFN